MEGTVANPVFGFFFGLPVEIVLEVAVLYRTRSSRKC